MEITFTNLLVTLYNTILDRNSQVSFDYRVKVPITLVCELLEVYNNVEEFKHKSDIKY